MGHLLNLTLTSGLCIMFMLKIPELLNLSLSSKTTGTFTIGKEQHVFLDKEMFAVFPKLWVSKLQKIADATSTFENNTWQFLLVKLHLSRSK